MIARRYGIFVTFIAMILVINIVLRNPWWSYLVWAAGSCALLFSSWAMNRLDKQERS